MDSIAERIRKRLEHHQQPVFKALAERLEALRQAQLAKAEDSIDFLREIFTVARDLKVAEKADDAGELELLPDPRVGALTQIFEEFRPPNTPVIVADVVHAVDRIVIEVAFDGWVRTTEGEKDVRVELRRALRKFSLPSKANSSTGPTSTSPRTTKADIGVVRLALCCDKRCPTTIRPLCSPTRREERTG
jgi:type I restriction enzyme, R subunit